MQCYPMVNMAPKYGVTDFLAKKKLMHISILNCHACLNWPVQYNQLCVMATLGVLTLQVILYDKEQFGAVTSMACELRRCPYFFKCSNYHNWVAIYMNLLHKEPQNLCIIMIHICIQRKHRDKHLNTLI